MRAEFINPFVAAGVQVLESVMESAPQPGQLAVRSATFTTQQVSIVVGVTGRIEGQAVYGMSLVTATKVAAAMSGMPAITFDELASSAIAELGNMVSGHAATLLSNAGYECQITPPTLIRGANIEISTSTPALVVPLHTDFGKIEINVAVRENRPAGAADGQGAQVASLRHAEADSGVSGLQSRNGACVRQPTDGAEAPKHQGHASGEV